MPGPQIDLSELSPALQKEFLEGRYVKEVNAAMAGMRNQVRLNREALKDHRSVDGLGSPRHYIDPTVYAYWARREGSALVWKEKQHLRYLHNRGLAPIAAKGTRVQVQGHDFGGQRAPSQKRFTKRYAL